MSDQPTHRGRPRGSENHHCGNLVKQCPCPRRKWAKCRHAYFFNFRYNKTSYRGSLHKLLNKPRGYFMSRTEAERHRDELKARIRDGAWIHPKVASAPAPTGLTFDAVAARYVDHFAGQTWQGAVRRPHRVVRMRHQLALIGRTEIATARGTIRFGDRVFADLVTEDIDNWRDAHLAHLQQNARDRVASPARARSRSGLIGLNRHLEVLRSVFTFGIRKGLYAATHPFTRSGTRLIAFAKEESRSRRLLPGEEPALLAAATAVPHLHDLIVAALETGGRRGELLALTWADLHPNARGIVCVHFAADSTKMGIAHRVPVSPRLATVLEHRRYAPDGAAHPLTAAIFGNAVGEHIDSVKTSWGTCCAKAHVRDLHFHDLRRECGSRWLEGGINLRTVSRMLGHAKISTTDTYLKTSEAVDEREMTAFHARELAAPIAKPKQRAS
jgi:integrase